jgi:yeast amino acid transporter
MQALALRGMAPKFLAYVDKHGRPLWSVAIALAFGMLAFINEAHDGGDVFTWLLALSSLSNFFVWGSICLSHMRFRMAWKRAGRGLEELPFRSDVGFWGSAIGLGIVVICLMATFYVDLFPIGGDPDAKTFFEGYLAAPIAIAFWAFWKVWSRQWRIFTPLSEIDLDTGRREYPGLTPEPPMNAFRRVLRIVF